MALGNVAAAQKALRQAQTIAEAQGARRSGWQILATLADTAARLDNDQMALSLRHEARLTLDFIIEHIPEGELRASFVGLPTVQAVLKGEGQSVDRYNLRHAESYPPGRRSGRVWWSGSC